MWGRVQSFHALSRSTVLRKFHIFSYLEDPSYLAFFVFYGSWITQAWLVRLLSSVGHFKLLSLLSLEVIEWEWLFQCSNYDLVLQWPSPSWSYLVAAQPSVKILAYSKTFITLESPRILGVVCQKTTWQANIFAFITEGTQIWLRTHSCCFHSGCKRILVIIKLMHNFN